VGWWIGFCLIRQPSTTPIVCFHQSKQVPVPTKSFESITLTKIIYDAFSKKNQTSRGDWVHPTLASRNSDSDFAPDFSAAGLHIRILKGCRFCEDKGNANNIKSTHMKLETLKDLYIQELKDLYSAEKQIIKALPKMVKAANNKQLAAGFEEHLKQTKEHVARLEKILTSHDESTRGPKCEGMEGVLKEGEEMIKEDADEEVRDAGLIAAAQRVEHYEMAGYGCARTYAELLGDPDGAQLLQTTLTEESDTDKKLTKLANSVINVAAQ
jgi:ferritin-like metal-binding protein YciE